MGTTNYIGAVVKILETPKQKLFKKNIFAVKCRVQFPYLKSSKMIHLTFWGNLARDVLKYYKINDYILIEGYVSLRNKKNSNPTSKNLKQTEISVFKVYPFLLSRSKPIN